MNNSKRSHRGLQVAALFQVMSLVCIWFIVGLADSENPERLITALACCSVGAQLLAMFAVAVVYSECAIDRVFGGGLVQRR